MSQSMRKPCWRGGTMVKKRDFGHLREALERRRNEIFGLRGSIDESWKGLQEGEVEYEETASKSAMSLSLEQLDERETREIEAIDLALRRIETGDYGICLSCGKSISPGRLEAIPWTSVCTRCAAEGEGKPALVVALEKTGADLPQEYEGMSDDELTAVIYDELEIDGRVEREDLDIKVCDGVVHLRGALPSGTSHQILLEILQDNMGLQEIEDRLRIEELPWQKDDRETPERKKTKLEEAFQGEDIEEDVVHSLKSGKPLSPPDEFVPEKEER
ncbi:MAG: TraR/DksA C4-type zinc finger protein [Deltaproteobacteria bacterium]|nr:TraR/DksA C4-type zinc finger protein [Deltaproteobacteria bacterium]